jgi:hypothetical protein
VTGWVRDLTQMSWVTRIDWAVAGCPPDTDGLGHDTDGLDDTDTLGDSMDRLGDRLGHPK